MLDNNLLGPLSLIRAYNNPGKELMLHLRCPWYQQTTQKT